MAYPELLHEGGVGVMKKIPIFLYELSQVFFCHGEVKPLTLSVRLPLYVITLNPYTSIKILMKYKTS